MFAPMTGAELIRKLRAVARKRGGVFETIASRGKGSHITVVFDDKRTIVPDPRRELKTGTLHAILKQLGLNAGDL